MLKTGTTSYLVTMKNRAICEPRTTNTKGFCKFERKTHLPDPPAPCTRANPSRLQVSISQSLLYNFLHQDRLSIKMLPGSGSDLPPFGTGIGSGSGSNPPGPRPRFPFGTSFENAVLSFAAERNPDTEHYIVVDLSRGFIRTTVNEAREYAELGHAVFDLAGWRPVWDPPLEITRKSREEVNDAFHDQYTEIWDLEDQAQAMNDAHLDEEIFYGVSLLCAKHCCTKRN